MKSANTDSELPAKAEVRVAEPQAPQPPKIKTKAKATSRSELKHFGAYLNDEMIEKTVLLRARLKLDNSQLVKLAIEDLWKKQRAKKAFSD